MEAERYTYIKDEDCLMWDCIADAVQEYVDDGGTENEIKIYVFKRNEFTEESKSQCVDIVLTNIYDWMNVYYGNYGAQTDENKPNEEIKQIAKTLIDKIAENYRVYQCSMVGQQTVKVSDYVEQEEV